MVRTVAKHSWQLNGFKKLNNEGPPLVNFRDWLFLFFKKFMYSFFNFYKLYLTIQLFVAISITKIIYFKRNVPRALFWNLFCFQSVFENVVDASTCLLSYPDTWIFFHTCNWISGIVRVHQKSSIWRTFFFR